MIRTENVLKTSLQESWRCLEYVLEISWRHFCNTSWRSLEDVLKMSWQDVLKTSWRLLLKTKTKDAYNTSKRRFHQDECLLGCTCLTIYLARRLLNVLNDPVKFRIWKVLQILLRFTKGTWIIATWYTMLQLQFCVPFLVYETNFESKLLRAFAWIY